MSNGHRDDSGANYGIVGNVTAKAVAVGAGASATVNETQGGRAELETALQKLEEEIRGLHLTSEQAKLLSEDVKKLKQLDGKGPETSGPAASILSGLVAKLKMVGVVAESVISLKEPLTMIANWFGVAGLF